MTDLQRASWWTPAAVTSLLPALAPGGRLCVQVPLLPDVNPAAVLSSLRAAGLEVRHWRVAAPQPGCSDALACSSQLEIVAMRA